MKTYKLLVILTLTILLLISVSSPNKSFASTFFKDEFNGDGELSNYNSLYKHVLNFNPEGTFLLSNGHLFASGYDPEYIYTGIQPDDKCASIEFNWEGEPRWTGIAIKSTLDDWRYEVQVDGRNGTKWYFYSRVEDTAESGSISFDFSTNHVLKACISGSSVEGFLDGNPILNTTFNNNYDGYFGFMSQIGTPFLDNFTIESFQNNNNINLDVPLLKQTSTPWKSKVYDSALIWNPKDPSINSWGCALTSAAMVFKYHGINKLPSNTDLDPGSLNNWLKSQKDGYVGNGLVNWLSLARLSKLAKNVNNLDYDALEYTRTNGNSTNQLSDALSNNLPGILSEPGHFIVGKGVNNNVFSINDPYYSRTSLSDYGNSFQNLGLYKPSHTDLSYIMLTIQPNINIQLLDQNNDSLGEAFTEGPITNPNNQNQNTDALKILYFQKPPDGDYKVILSSSSSSAFNLNIYSYNKDGDVFIKSNSGNVSQGNSKTINFQFNGQINLYDKKVTFLSTAFDLEKFRKQKLITNEATKLYLDNLLAKAFAADLIKSDELEQKYFSDFVDYLGNTNKVLEPASSTLLYDINYLSSHL